MDAVGGVTSLSKGVGRAGWTYRSLFWMEYVTLSWESGESLSMYSCLCVELELRLSRAKKNT